MLSKLIKKLVVHSKTKGKLDAVKIAKIAKMLQRNELKEYLFLLKRARAEETVIIESSSNLTKQSMKALKSKFKNKEIIVTQRKDTIGGMKFFIKDTTIDFTVKGLLERIQNTLRANA